MERNFPTKTNGSSNNLQHVCKVCNRLLTSPYKLREHMMIHTGEKPHACKVCKQAFRTKPDLSRHMRIHTGERPYSCKLCGQRFHRSDNLRGHMKVHKDKDTEGLPYTSHIVRHKSENSKISLSMAPVLKEKRNAKSQREKSTLVQAKPKNDFEEETFYPIDLQMLPAGKKVNQLLCVECDCSFYQKGAFAMHMKIVHGRGSPRSASPVTSVSSSSLSPAHDYEPHYEADASSSVYLCRYCGVLFEDLQMLEKHTTTKHETDFEVDINKKRTGIDENMNCTPSEDWTNDSESDSVKEYDEDFVINNGTSEEDYRGADLMVNSNHKETPSDVQFSDFTNWNGSGEAAKPFSCDEYDQKFSWKQDLNRHKVMVHTAHVPYRCSACGKGFLRQDRLVAHIRVHTGKSPHTCDHCHKSFTASSSLKEHMKIHTGEKPHHCYLCGKDFRQKCVLTRHVRNVHKVELDQATHPPTVEAEAHEINMPVVSPEERKPALDEPIDFSAKRSNSSVKIEPSEIDKDHLDEKMQKDKKESPVNVTNTPILLEHLNNKVKLFESAVISNGITHSCAACSTKFSNLEDLSVHLTSHHVGIVKDNPVQQSSVLPVAPRSKIPNVITKQDGINFTPMGKLLIREEISNTPPSQSLKNAAHNPLPNDFTQPLYLNNTIHGNGSDYDSEPSGNSSLQNSPVHQMVYVSIKSSLKCTLCGLMFNNQQELNNHSNSHLQSNPFFCGLCSNTFRNTTELQDHITTHAKLIENIQDLREGELDSSSESSITCYVCHEQLEEESELAEHMKMHCPGLGTAVYSCTLCDKNCHKPEQMNTHFGQTHCSNLSRDSDLRLFGCNFCFKPFKKIRTLVLHLKSHLMDKPHLCEMCDKSFSQQAYLKQHVRTHTGERPYFCVVCNRRFTQKTQLILHEWQHRGETPLSCETCGKAFTNKSVLKLHLMTHLTLPPYKCKICSRRFTQAGNVRRHIGMVHKDVEIGGAPMYTCDLDLSEDIRDTKESVANEKEASESLDVLPLDLSKHGDGPVNDDVDRGAPRGGTRNQKGDQEETAEEDDDDFVVMGAYYHQQKSVFLDPNESTLKKPLNSGDIQLSQKPVAFVNGMVHFTRENRKRQSENMLFHQPEKKMKVVDVIDVTDGIIAMKKDIYDCQSRCGTNDMDENEDFQRNGNMKATDELSEDDNKCSECKVCIKGFANAAAMSAHVVKVHGPVMHI